MTVRVDRDTLEALHLRGEAQRELARRRALEQAEEEAAEEADAIMGCFGCFGKRSQNKEWDDVHRRRAEARKNHGEDRVCREKKSVNIRVNQMTERWAKEHFAQAKKVKAQLAAQEMVDEDRRTTREAAKRRAEEKANPVEKPAGIRFRAADNKAHLDALPSPTDFVEDQQSFKDLVLSKVRQHVGSNVDKEALDLYRSWKEKEHADKEIAIAPLVRMKQMRSRYLPEARHAGSDGEAAAAQKDGQAGVRRPAPASSSAAATEPAGRPASTSDSASRPTSTSDSAGRRTCGFDAVEGAHPGSAVSG